MFEVFLISLALLSPMQPTVSQLTTYVQRELHDVNYLNSRDFDYRMEQLAKPLGYHTIEAEVTFYNENDEHTPGTVMANGHKVHYGAVANDQLKLGTVVKIDGETFVVSDRFGAGHPVERFDVYMPSRGDCDRFGRQKKTVKIMEE